MADVKELNSLWSALGGLNLLVKRAVAPRTITRLTEGRIVIRDGALIDPSAPWERGPVVEGLEIDPSKPWERAIEGEPLEIDPGDPWPRK